MSTGRVVNTNVSIRLAPPPFGTKVNALPVVERNSETPVVALCHALPVRLSKFGGRTRQHTAPSRVVPEPVRVAAVLNADVLP